MLFTKGIFDCIRKSRRCQRASCNKSYSISRNRNFSLGRSGLHFALRGRRSVLAPPHLLRRCRWQHAHYWVSCRRGGNGHRENPFHVVCETHHLARLCWLSGRHGNHLGRNTRARLMTITHTFPF